MKAAAQVLQLHAPEAERELPIVHSQSVIAGDPRTVAVAMFRMLADKLESGELDGARVEWSFNLPNLTTVIRDSKHVALNVARLVDESKGA